MEFNRLFCEIGLRSASYNDYIPENAERSSMTDFLPKKRKERPGWPAAWSWLLTAGLLTLLVILASLQYRWLEEVSRADRDKSRDLLQAAVERFAEDFDRELTRAFLYLQPDHAAFDPTRQGGRRPRETVSFADRYQRWQAFAPFPDLVRDVYMARRGGEGALEVSRFDPAERSFVPAPWPGELEPLRRRLAAERRRPRRREPRQGNPGFQLLAAEVPAVILPVLGAGPPSMGPPGMGPPGAGSGARPSGAGPPGGRGFVVLHLDLDIIRGLILPQLSQRHLNGRDGTEYRAHVFALRDQRTIFRRGAPPEEGTPHGGDAGAELFGLLPPEELGTLELEAGLARPELESSAGPPGRRLREDRYHRLYRFISAGEGPRWRLEASHPAGSLDAAVAGAHRRNLAIGFGILLLLGATLLLLLRSTRRTQNLARQQLEFVAGVTHELLTPLAAMRSAGQNLADGVVAEPGQVRRYGRLVEDEGRRLSTMVEQVLEFAGMQAGGRSYTLERTRLTQVIDGALAQVRPLLDERGVRVEKQIDRDLPEVMADAEALRRAVQNLLANAVKYGQGAEAWLGVRASAGDGPRGTELKLSVEDRGGGISAADLPRLFEPFYRGTAGSSIAAGSGLGLSLVKHIVEGHGGRVTVASEEGAGSTFTIHLPVAPSRFAGGGPEDADEL